ncbi:MAG: GNAT family N-acetyltransferase [Thalassotalea sp.]
MAAQLIVTLVPVDKNQIKNIKASWLILEENACNSIFTSWYWIETWLAFIDYNTHLLQVTYQDKIIGLGFLSEHTFVKYGVSSKQLWLNRTGDTAKDQIWNEYNDILCADGHEYAIRSAVLNHFESHLKDFDELIIGVSNASIVETPHSNKLMQLATWQTTSYHTKLNDDIANFNSYLTSLSANSRSQIRRTAKLLGGIDNLSITKAQNTQQAQQFLKAAGELHIKRWENQNSGFENPYFISFHNDFIERHFDHGVVDLLKVENNDRIICYLYNFRYKDTIYFYLSGIEYSQDNRLKPGMLAHSLAIVDYAKQGFDIYDFMGGDGRYKKSLSNESGTMIISNYRRKKPAFLASHLLRRIKKAVS